MSNIIKLPTVNVAEFVQTDFKPEIAKALITTALDSAKEVTAIITQSDLDQASLVISDIKKINASLEKHRKQMKEPAKTYGEGVDSYFKALGSDLSPELSRLTGGVETYLKRQRAIEQAKAEEERIKMQDILDAEKKLAEANNQPIPQTIVPEVVVKHEKLSTQNVAGISTRRYKKWEVVDIALVPIQYLQVNEVLMNKKRSETSFEGESPVPGIKYSFEEKI